MCLCNVRIGECSKFEVKRREKKVEEVKREDRRESRFVCRTCMTGDWAGAGCGVEVGVLQVGISFRKE